MLAGKSRAFNGFANTFGHREGRRFTDVDEDEGEFLAAVTIEAISFTQGVFQYLSHFLQGYVADPMAEVIVETLEVVEVRHGDDEIAAGCDQPLQIAVH